LTNGDPLTAAEAVGFEIFLTADKNIQYQQNLAGRGIVPVVLGTYRRHGTDAAAGATTGADTGGWGRGGVSGFSPRGAAEGRTLKDASAHIMTYIHPDAAKALKRYAVENNCKVHDICVEALESWFRAHGLREKGRAEPKRAN
jgi:hypothetical protein